MPLQACPEGSSLIANVAEALSRQCDLRSDIASPDASQGTSETELAGKREIALALRAANRRATEHLMKCPICRSH
ncbi:MAG: hypothetical protein JWM43_3381 [Acidobacteriaceae bacterium]|nr:hypothetical protein [Acidobacteriaceae bacterium]